MKKYTKAQAKSIRLKTFSATTKNGLTLVRAFLKENAARKMEVDINEVEESSWIISSLPCDELIECMEYPYTESHFEIRYRQD